ncbi:uncharacterized protein BJ212DRAFT_1301947 [Suillus subaureus]|uniref:LYC1 C-terminal domain-containing protein n=1 Tax=Suillus subaureus TaxID=48587 RepID=A0A9P7E5L5_9AGAM|nr:uncharacterized protein BJ212DRAFT_1301947 [Suillus subaureus]KAG1811419.1 hypothetical protein BJ212DRAFT_1301947 [Suillus subaureus]
MPPRDLAALLLYPATHAQVLETRERTWPHWGGSTTLEQYLQCCERMDEMEHTRDGRIMTWVLAPRDPTTLDFMCACETYKRTGLVAYPSPDGPNKVNETPCYGIASAYIPEAKRRKGYEQHRMCLLHWVISSCDDFVEFPKEWGVPPPKVDGAGGAAFSVLYSAVGEDFYGNAGVQAEDKAGQMEKVPGRVEESPGWKWVEEGDLDEMWREDAGFIKNSLEGTPRSDPSYETPSPTAFVSALPDRGVGSFQVVRSLLVSGHAVPLKVWGIRKENIGDERRATETFPELLENIKEAAQSAGLEKVEVWNLPRYLDGLAEGEGNEDGKKYEPTRGLPVIKWYRGRGETRDVEWSFNERLIYGTGSAGAEV